MPADATRDTATLAASKDLYEFLCVPGERNGPPHDIAMSTAAHLSS